MIFWKHLKGLSATNLYTFIRFSEEPNDNDDNNDIKFLPKIYLTNTTAFNNGRDLGSILTSNVVNGYFNNTFKFKNEVSFVNESDESLLKIQWHHKQSEQDINEWRLITAQNFLQEAVNHTINATTLIINATNAVTINNQINTHRLEVSAIEGDETYDGSVTGVYFNTTSDYRAKKDFKLLDINALELVKKVQLYSFKYKESNQSSIGIIAQDVQDVNIGGFDLVDNKEATGANFDYMSIHESKLIYILWKAIQEQQKEIEELKQQLKK